MGRITYVPHTHCWKPMSIVSVICRRPLTRQPHTVHRNGSTELWQELYFLFPLIPLLLGDSEVCLAEGGRYLPVSLGRVLRLSSFVMEWRQGPLNGCQKQLSEPATGSDEQNVATFRLDNIKKGEKKQEQYGWYWNIARLSYTRKEDTAQRPSTSKLFPRNEIIRN